VLLLKCYAKNAYKLYVLTVYVLQ